MSKISLLRTMYFQLLFFIALVTGIGIAFAVDTDTDGMSDVYENFFHLNPTNAADAAGNPDTDTLVNQQEALLWTDPNANDTDADGLEDGADSNALSRAVMWWGNPDFTQGDEYFYTGPDWWLGAGRSGGDWLADGGWQVESNAPGILYIDIDRAIVTNDLMLNLLHENATNSLVYLDLADTNDTMVAVDLYGDLTTDDGSQVLSRYILPLAGNPTASRIIIEAEAGAVPYTVWASTLYEDADADGLDADQEKQFGTSDTNPDGDADGLTDYDETMVLHTDPLDPDSDHDGFTDGLELNELGTSPLVPMWQEGGLPGKLTVERWNGIPGADVADLVRSAKFGNTPDECSWVSTSEYASNGLDAGDNYGIRIRGTITAPVDGEYTFWLTGDDTAQVWLSDTDSPYGRKRILDLEGWTSYRELTNWWVHGSEPVTLSASQSCYVEILFKEIGVADHVSLWWTRPGQTEPEIIGPEYLHSYVQPADDQDMDGLPDALETAGGLDPLDGTGGGYLDTDNDGFSDQEEINELGTSPLVPMWQEGGVAGMLQVERWNGIPGDDVADLVESAKFGNTPDERSWVSISEYANPYTRDSGDDYGIRMRGTITAPADGEYTFWLTGDDAAQVWLSDTDSPYGRKRILDLESWTGYREISSGWVRGSEPVILSANQSCYVEILFKEGGIADHVTLWWTRPGQAEPEIIGPEYLHSYVQPADDQDMDGLPDAQELAYGLDPSNGMGGGYRDTDGDGFSDHEEITLMGTSPIVSMWQDGVAGVLEVERWNGIDGATIADLKADGRFGGAPDAASLVTSTEYAPNGLDAGANYGIRMRGTITAPSDGTYTFQLTGDDAAQVWLSDNESPYDRQLLLDLKAWTGFRNLSNSKAPSATVTLSSNQTCYVEILFKESLVEDHVTLWWTRPGETHPEIIASQYLHSYVQPADDADADGLPDAWELAHGLDPSNCIGGGFKDTDGDGYSDFVEFAFGLDPQVADADADGLSDGDEIFITQTGPDSADTDADGISDLRTVLSIPGAGFVDRFDSHITATWSTDGSDAIVSKPLANPWVLYNLEVTTSGMYRIAVDTTNLSGYAVRLGVEIDGIEIGELWMNHSSDLPAYTFFTPWLSEGEHTLKLIPRCYFWDAGSFRIHSIELGAIDGVDADGNGIQDWMNAILDKGIDTDGDGISDFDEITIHHTRPTDADSDNDGLNDGDELAAGTDPLDADSDDDGVVDGVEVHETLTNPLVTEFDGTVETILTVAGAQTNGAAGEWEAVGSEIISKGRRGYVEYTMDFPTNDLYCLNINAAHLWQKSSCSPVDPIEESAFLVYVDGTYVGAYPLITADGVYEDVRAFLPVLPAGEHTVHLFWENVHTRLAVQIKDAKLQSLGGPDNNANGVKDWIEASIAAMAGVDAVPQSSGLPRIESYISPACVEGNARYPEFASLEIQSEVGNQQSAIARGAGSRWYANLPLDQNGITTASATFQNGALQVPVSIDWVPYNIIDHDGEILYVRKGDMVKFVALPEECVGGQFEIEYTLGMDDESIRAPNTRPLIYLFSSAGSYTITGQYTHGNDTVTAAITVVVLDGAFLEESPACLVGKQRDWTFTGMPSNVVYEVDGTVDMAIQGASLTTNSNQQTTVSLTAHEANGEHMIVARAGEHGPILDSARLDTCWIQNAADGYFWTMAKYEDSELWEVESIQANLPPTVDLRIKVIVGGVTFDDYTLERWITSPDYDDTGVYSFRLFHPNDEVASVCHIFMAYQNGQFIGEIFGGEQE